jgi:probable HAF family extracellular repeat protein
MCLRFIRIVLSTFFFLLVLAAAALPAQAGIPVERLRQAEQICFDELSFMGRGTLVLVVGCVPKATGTLNFALTIPGLDSQPLQFTAVVSGDTATWRFEALEAFTYVVGELIVDLRLEAVERNYGDSAGRRRFDVRGVSRPASQLSSFDLRGFQIVRTDTPMTMLVAGGLPPARLNALTLERRQVCKSAARQGLSGTVEMLGPVSYPAGLVVDITSSDESQVHAWDPFVFYQAYSAPVSIVIEPNAEGTFWLNASADGVVVARQRLDIKPCLAPVLPPEPVIWPHVFRPIGDDCLACGIIDFTRGLDLLAWLGKRIVRVQVGGELEDLTEVLGEHAVALASNTRGEIVGSNAKGGFVWSSQTGLVPLAHAPVDVNGWGAIAANDLSVAKAPQAFLLARGKTTALGGLGGAWTRAAGVDDLGRVVGSSEDAQGRERAFLFDEDGKLHDLGDLGGGQSRATLVSSTGHIAGVALTAELEWHAFVLDEQGKPIDLIAGADMHAFVGAWPVAIDDRGRVLFHAYTSEGVIESFVRDAEATHPVAKLVEGYQQAITLSDSGELLVEGQDDLLVVSLGEP